MTSLDLQHIHTKRILDHRQNMPSQMARAIKHNRGNCKQGQSTATSDISVSLNNSVSVNKMASIHDKQNAMTKLVENNEETMGTRTTNDDMVNIDMKKIGRKGAANGP